MVAENVLSQDADGFLTFIPKQLNQPYSSMGSRAQGYSLIYKLCRYVPPQRVWFFKMGIDFGQYGMKSGIVFKGTERAYKCICLFKSIE